MEYCPACNASTAGEQTCRRCKMDLGPLIAVEDGALMHIREALAAFESQDFCAMQFRARRAFSLKKTKTTVRLLAVASLLNKDYPQAMLQWVNLLSNDRNASQLKKSPKRNLSCDFKKSRNQGIMRPEV
jgi:hypothetical protein